MLFVGFVRSLLAMTIKSFPTALFTEPTVSRETADQRGVPLAIISLAVFQLP